MPKTHDEKREAFQRMLAIRLPKAVKAIELLANLARKGDYAWTNAVLQDMTDQLDAAFDVVASAFGIELDQEGAPPGGYAPGMLSANEIVDDYEHKAAAYDQRSEVRWAYDALSRGDNELAKDRLRRVVEYWLEEEPYHG